MFASKPCPSRNPKGFACCACSLRRVRCVRQLGGNGLPDLKLSCLGCIKLKIKCVELVQSPRKIGKSVEKCKELFGSTDEKIGAIAPAEDYLHQFRSLADSFIVSGLVSAGYEPGSLLRRAMVAVGSRISETIVSPRDSTMAGGEQRERICLKLQEECIQNLNSVGVFLDANIENVEAVLLLEILSVWKESSRMTSRKYLAIAVEQLRELHCGRIQFSEKFEHILIRDALASAYSLRPPLISDSECTQFLATRIGSELFWKVIADLRFISALHQSIEQLQIDSAVLTIREMWKFHLVLFGSQTMEDQPQMIIFRAHAIYLIQTLILSNTSFHFLLEESNLHLLDSSRAIARMVAERLLTDEKLHSLAFSLDVAPYLAHLRLMPENSLEGFTFQEKRYEIKILMKAESCLHSIWSNKSQSPNLFHPALPSPESWETFSDAMSSSSTLEECDHDNEYPFFFSV